VLGKMSIEEAEEVVRLLSEVWILGNKLWKFFKVFLFHEILLMNY